MRAPEPAEPPREEKAGRSLLVRAALVLAALLGGLTVILGAALLLLDTSAGHRFAAKRLSAFEFANGLQVRVGRIDGSLYGSAVLHDVSLNDPRGEFLAAPAVALDWRPFAWIANHVDVRSLTAQTAVLRRQPALRPSAQNQPLLPNVDIDVGKLAIERLTVEPALTGSRQVVALHGRAHIADRRAQASLRLVTLASDNPAARDHLALTLDAVPEANRLAFSLTLDAPARGVIAKLARLSVPIALQADGSGDWHKWNGTFTADLNGHTAARLALTARDGAFAAKGPLEFAQGPFERATTMLGNAMQLSLSSRWDQREAAIDGTLRGSTGMLTVAGKADFGRNRFNQLRLDLRHAGAGALGPNVSGHGLAAHAELDGAFAAPTIAYRVNAARLNFGELTLAGLQAQGRAKMARDHWIVPVSARADSITGLDTLAGGPLGAVAISGDLAIDWPRILSDNLRITAERVDARAIVIADTAKGLYAGTFAGRVKDYRVRSVGIFALDTQAEIKSLTQGGFALTGSIKAQSTRLFEGGLRDILGEHVTAAAQLAYGPDRVVRFNALRLTSPSLVLSDGSGTYGADGRITMNAQGIARDYGAVRLAFAGTLDRPTATLTAERGGMGIGLAQIHAQLEPEGNDWRIHATASSDLGPVSASLRVKPGAALTLAVDRAEIGGIGLSGDLRRLPDGPFSGTLVASGQGVQGQLLLDAAGRYQHLALTLRASNTMLPGAAQMTVGRALIDADAVLSPHPQVTADVQLAQTRVRTLDVSALRLQLAYRSGSGTLRALAEGSTGVPFRLALNGAFEPDLWRLALRGKVNGIAVATAEPARVVPRGDSYELAQTRFDLDRGNLTLGGTFGANTRISGSLDKVDVALINAFRPGLGLGGFASGDFSWRQDPTGFPVIDAQLAVRGFRHTTAEAVSRPMDVNLTAAMTASLADFRAVARMNDTIAGRLQAQIVPAAPITGGWSDRLAQGRLQGGIRYTGPADLLFAFARLPDQRLSGPLALAADISCSLADPCLNGVLGGKGMVYENARYGTRLTDMAVTGRFTGERLQIDQLSARAGDGSVTGQGYVSLASAAGYPANIALTFANARIADSDAMRATASGAVTLIKAANAMPVLSGTVTLPASRYQMIRQGVAQVPELDGVRFKQTGLAARATGAAAVGNGYSKIALDLHVIAPNRFVMNGMGMESEWSADLKVTGTADAPKLTGRASLQRGSLDFAGKSFTLTDGQVTFPGGGTQDAQVRLIGEETFQDVTVNLTVTGSAAHPQIAFSSVPGLPQDEIVSRMLFGSSVGNLSAIEALQLAASLNTLRGSGTGLNPLGKLQAATGFDRLRILAADEATGRGTALAVGKHITDKLYIEVVSDARGYTATQLEVALSRSLSVLSQAGGTNSVNVGLRFRKTY